ncbi:MAG: hypothetical protein HY855_07895 [Burkholderiales bacterium]|nr:hypothetical protein [Burkholderiales bacterium]
MSIDRRTCFGIPFALSPWLGACGGGGESLLDAETGPSAKALAAVRGRVADTSLTVPPLGKYRSTQPWLFVDAQASTPMTRGAGMWMETPARASLSGAKSGYAWGNYGPSYRFVEQYGQWAWRNPGGDWIDAGGVAQSTARPHFRFTANAATTGASAYTADITAGVEGARSAGRWNGYIVKCSGGQRAIATHHHASLPGPSISVTYTDGTTGTLSCVACTRLTPGTAYTQLGNAEAVIDTAVALEFERAAKPVASATLRITLSQHSATGATITGFLVNPPLNVQPVRAGISVDYPLDANLATNATVLFAHRYQDGSTLQDWIHPQAPVNVWSMNAWSPHLFGTGATNTDRLPYKYNGAPAPGKWFFKQYTSTVSLVNSSYTGNNFAPLAPGLGALRVVVPAANAADGAAFSPAGSLGSDLWAVFDEARCGNLDRVFTRFYVRLGSTAAPLAETKMFRQTGGTAYYASRGGKFGPGVHHWTHYGGNNNVGGKNLGWTNRGAFMELPSDAPMGGVIPGCHSWDMIGYNMQWGQDGGLGGTLMPDRWYCIEVDCQLNTFNPAGGSPADGVMTIYVDGRLAARHTGWRYRDGPIDYAKTTPLTNLAPFRKMGPIGLLLQDYNGGVLPPDRDLVLFYTGIVASTSYVGPMSMSASSDGLKLTGRAWLPNRDDAGEVLMSDLTKLPVNQWLDVAGPGSRLDNVLEFPRPPRAGNSSGDASANIIAAWGGAAWDHQNQRMIIAGGGHGDLAEWATGIYGVSASRLSFERLVNSQSPAAVQSWNYTTHKLEPVSRGNATNVPLTTGVPSFTHTYDGLVWLPPGTPGAGPMKGGLFIPGNARTVVNLDTGVYQTTHWNNPETDIQDWSYCTAFVDGHAVYGPRGSWFHFKYDLTRTQSTTWHPKSFGDMKTAYARCSVPVPYANKMWGWMRERREYVTFATTGIVRVRYGQALIGDADATLHDWTPFIDAVTLVSSDGSHADFNAMTLADEGALSSAGIHYDHAAGCLWIQANPVGGCLYQVTGLATNTWTVRKIAGTEARYAPVHMTYGRFRVATVGGVKLAIRVTGTTDPLQVMRLA